MSALRHLIPRPLRLQASAWLAERGSAALARDLEGMAASGAPIVAGPWLGEVGFELLYWQPFLAWCVERFDIAPGRVTVVSRGGTASWYARFASHYADAFDRVSPEAFKAAHDARVAEVGEQKQTRETEFDRRLIADVTRANGLAGAARLHPSSMYRLFSPFWWGHLPIAWVHRHARYGRLNAPAVPASARLPSSYVAAKFYFNDCFPATDANRTFVRDTLKTLASRGPVVSLTTGLDIDDHDGYRVDELGVMHLPEGLPASRNLEAQSAVVAGARAFVGTYGGFSYLAPLHGVPSVAYYSDPDGFSRKHLDVVRSALAAIGTPELLHVRSTREPEPEPATEPEHPSTRAT